jgi:hypothetical protein
MIGGDSFKPTDGDGFCFDALAPACGLAGPIAHSSQNAGKDVRVAIHHVRFGEFTLCDQANVFGNIGVGRTRPLTVDDPVKIVRVLGIGRLHFSWPFSLAEVRVQQRPLDTLWHCCHPLKRASTWRCLL